VRRRWFLSIGLVAVLGLTPSAAGPPTRPHGLLITVLLSQDIEPYRQALAGFQRAFAGTPAPRYEIASLDGPDAPTHAALTPRVGAGADLVLAIGARAARAVRALDIRTPVVFAAVSGAEMPADAESAGRPAVGVSTDFAFALQFQTLRAVAPRVKTVGTIHDRANRPAILQAAVAAREAGLTLVPVEISTVEEIPGSLENLIGRVDALWALPDALVFSRETSSYIILQTLRRRVPFMSFSQNFVKAGSLVSLYPDFEDIGRQAGVMGRDLLEGRRPAAGDVARPRKALLALNLRVADVIGLSIPAGVRRRATTIYE
jgi:putative ABC transport system substrate-binding protein